MNLVWPICSYGPWLEFLFSSKTPIWLVKNTKLSLFLWNPNLRVCSVNECILQEHVFCCQWASRRGFLFQKKRHPLGIWQFSVLSSQFSVLSSQLSALSSQFSVLSSQISVLSSQLLRPGGTSCPDTGGTFRGNHSCPTFFKSLSKNPSRQA